MVNSEVIHVRFLSDSQVNYCTIFLSILLDYFVVI
jgi:hypothetical protein